MLGSDHHRSLSKNIDVIDHTLLLNNPSPVLTWIFLDLSSSSVKRAGVPRQQGTRKEEIALEEGTFCNDET